MTIMCGAGDVSLPDAGEGACCIAAAVYGPGHCLCWEPVFDQEQAEPAPTPVATRATMCADCAYRPDSPERAAGDLDLDEIALTARFFCHQGMRRALRLRHPSGAVVELPPGAYEPLVDAAASYRADGTPADLCAGWAAARARLTEGV